MDIDKYNCYKILNYILYIIDNSIKMTGKAKPTATAKKPTAAAKKPTAAAKKPTPTAKKPTAAAKKPTPTAKKPTPTAKKPTAKFNLNKLIMLIGRNPQKKGKKMMGGAPYANTLLDGIKNIIHAFLLTNKNKLIKIIRDFYIDSGPTAGQGHAFATKNHTRSIAFNLLNLADFSDIPRRNIIIGGIAGNMSTEIFDGCNSPNFETKHIFNSNYMIIAQVLCKVYISLHNNSDDNQGNQIDILNIPDNPSVVALDASYDAINAIN